LAYFLGISGDPTELDDQFRVRDLVHERQHYFQEQMFKTASVKRRLDVEFLPLGDNGTLIVDERYLEACQLMYQLIIMQEYQAFIADFYWRPEEERDLVDTITLLSRFAKVPLLFVYNSSERTTSHFEDVIVKYKKNRLPGDDEKEPHLGPHALAQIAAITQRPNLLEEIENCDDLEKYIFDLAEDVAKNLDEMIVDPHSFIGKITTPFFEGINHKIRAKVQEVYEASRNFTIQIEGKNYTVAQLES
jgi:hypothetical protein